MRELESRVAKPGPDHGHVSSTDATARGRSSHAGPEESGTNTKCAGSEETVQGDDAIDGAR
jgi:hypothetical protein